LALLLLLLLQVAKLLVDAGADVSLPWSKGHFKGVPPLLLLLLQVAKLLVDAGADVSLPWSKGHFKGVPPLLYAGTPWQHRHH
jgi:hypothetical protein